MSLLLDALKKAADDKQKALQAESNDSEAVASISSNPDFENTNAIADTAQQTAAGVAVSDEDSVTDQIEVVEELTLEEITESIERAESLSDDVVDDSGSQSRSESSHIEEKSAVEVDLENTSDSRVEEFTVSDDALSMLIYKTNRDVKKEKKFIVFGVLAAGLTVLLSGGVYYYLDMQAEIEALERRHQITMQSMRAKTNKEKTPEKSEIIRKLVGESDLDDKVEFARQRIASDKNTFDSRPIEDKEARTNKRDVSPGSMLSIQKNKKTDLVGEKLDAAWLAYEAGRYDAATTEYKEVLAIEKNNRDALLGLGAIAVIKKDNVVARDIYLAILEQDPRDAMATAALAGLHDESSLKSDEEYLLSMLEKNPGAQHLNFALGNNYAQQNRWKSAQQHYFNAWQSDHENADYIFNLAVSLDQLNKQQQAINYYRESLLKAENKQVGFSREAVQKRINELARL